HKSFELCDIWPCFQCILCGFVGPKMQFAPYRRLQKLLTGFENEQLAAKKSVMPHHRGSVDAIIYLICM
ncbi:MAG: hypothetical protein WCD70_17005, partial [Alphaproteobacteria bacterium]